MPTYSVPGQSATNMKGPVAVVPSLARALRGRTNRRRRGRLLDLEVGGDRAGGGGAIDGAGSE